MLLLHLLLSSCFLLAPVLCQSLDVYPSPDDFRKDHLKHEPTFFVVASRMVRPGQVYQVRVSVFQTTYPIMVRAAIQRDGIEVASSVQELKQNIPETILLKVPTTSIPGSYKLRVEGNVLGILGGTAFSNETNLIFSQRSMTIFIQTDRPVYKQGQIVRFRALPITTGLKAFSDAVDLYMLDPNRKIVKRWLSRQTNLGAVSLEYPLSQQPVYGKWTIQVIAQGQVEEQTYLVEEYYQTRFEVNVTMPSFFTDIENYVYGTVEANYTSGVPVTGNLTLTAYIEPLRMNYRVGNKPTVIDQIFPIFDGTVNFKFPLRDFERLVPQLDRSKVTVTASVGDRYLNLIETGFSETVIYSSRVKLEFLGSSPQIFKPSMPYKVFLAVSYHDGSALPFHRMSKLKIQVTPTLEFHRGQTRRLSVRHEKMSTIHPGIWEVNMDLQAEFLTKSNLRDVKSMTLEAVYYDEFTGENAKASLKIYAAYSKNDRFLQISTSTRSPKVGEYIIFHVRSNYFVESFSYVIVSKGIILMSGQEMMTSSIKTFAISLSPEMAPTATAVIYSVAREGEVVVDSLTFPVNGLYKNNFTLTLNNKKDKTGDTIEVVIVGRPATYIGLSALDKALYDMKGGNEFGPAEVSQKMSLFDVGMNGSLTHMWHSKEGNLDEVVHFPASTYGIDAYTTLEYAGLVVFTDANVTKREDFCNASLGYLPCVDGGCYKSDKQCDGYKDCFDGSDESGCVKRTEYDQYLKDFKMHRVKRIQRLYDNAWLWHDINIGPLGYYIFNVPVPEIPTRWMVTSFGMNNVDGFGIQEKALEFSSVRPFYMNVEMPNRIMQGEQVGIRISVFNYMLYEIEALIVIANSPDYKFVHVESFGIVESYRPRTSYGEHQHLVLIKPGKSVVVYMPIVPTRLGDIDVTVMTKTQVAKDVITRTIHVEADGIPQYRHTTVQLDLSQGAYLIKYLDTNITETPIVPYRFERLYMFGSNRAQVSVVGDVTGPAFATMPVNASTLLRKPSWCGEQNMFNFAANLFTLLYLRLTGQRQPDIEKQAFRHLNIGYQRQLSYQQPDGSFVPFRWDSKPSVWLTAFCARIFFKATFQEWESFLYIDPDVISKAVNWLLDYQTLDGSFYETSPDPLDRKMDSSVDSPYGSARYRNISLTAHVLITLSELRDLRGDVGSKISTARERARRYLERMLPIVRHLEDPYELAIVTYALTLCNSPEANEALNYLDQHMREESGMRYWSRERVKGPTTKIENTRPYLISRLPHKYDASNIEATAYALLVHVEQNAVIQREIVEWLNSQRLTYGGWASTQDTIIAMQALIEHAIQSRVRDVIDVSITIEVPSVPGFIKHVHIGQENLSKQQNFEIPNAWGVVLVKAQGSGIALVQLSVQYNVDWPHLMTPPPVEAFSLVVKGFYHGRNSSHIEISACQKWTLLEESPKSGMAVLEVDIPTGYVVQQQILDQYVQSRRVRHLKEARYDERKVSFYFDYLDREPTCLTFTVQRWYPVANMTRWLPVRVYDYYAPERFNETMFDAYNLFVLSICHVCGSYQCPYCPIFSWGHRISPNSSLLLVILISYIIFKSFMHKL